MPATQRQVVAIEPVAPLDIPSLETSMSTPESRSTRVRRLLDLCAVLVTIPLLSALPAEAKVFKSYLDADLFGQLDQAKTECPKFGCGPTAAVNSFVYLQNSAPKVYGETLVPPTTAGQKPVEADLIKVANKVGSDHMKSCVPCGANDGTYIEDFIIGKRSYLETVAPGKTQYSAQINIKWRHGTAAEPDDAANKGIGKFAFVTDETKPTLSFLYNSIVSARDVELFFGDHYVTLTGIEYDDTTNTGKIAFIDPDGGKKSFANITGVTDGFVVTDYDTESKIFAAVAEAPVPEPGTWLFMAFGATVIAFRLRSGAGR